MFDSDFSEFARTLDGTCSVIARGTYKPDAQNAAAWFNILRPYSIEQVRAGFDAHLRCPDRGRFTPVPADVIAKIHANDGRPSSDEAWSIAVRAMDESATVTWTDEIAEAWGVAKPVFDLGDEVGARMAFRDAYHRITDAAKRAGKSANWWPTLGLEPTGRADEVHRAANAGLLEHSAALMLQAPDNQTMQRVADRAPPHARAALLALRDKLATKVPEPMPDPIVSQRTPTRDELEGAKGRDLMTLGIVGVKERERLA